jgi:hypothetical protein
MGLHQQAFKLFVVTYIIASSLMIVCIFMRARNKTDAIVELHNEKAKLRAYVMLGADFRILRAAP